MARTLHDLGIVIPPEEDTPLVRRLVEVIEKLTAEIHRLKGLPELPQRPARPSALSDDAGPPSQHEQRQADKKRRNRHKRSKVADLPIHDTIVLQPDAIPAAAKLRGYKSFVIQDLRIEAVNIRYRRACYELPDGTMLIAPRPETLRGQFGPRLRCFVLQQYYQNHVTEPLLRQQLADLGISISSGQISRLLTEGHDAFHREKDQLLPAARDISHYFQTDDTPARHQGRSGHTLHIGNEFFASFCTTDSKSRINFLEILRVPYTDYVLGGDALFYLQCHDFPRRRHGRIEALLEGATWTWDNPAEWERQLQDWDITHPEQRRLLTEAALWGSLMDHDLYLDQPLLSDDAAQFKLLGFAHGLCWLHAERHVARLIPLSRREQAAYDRSRDAIWHFYQRLKAYRQRPTARKRQYLERRFDQLFQARTGWPELNEALQTIHQKKANLLLVLEHPELPLHNNLSEGDIRQFAKMRKISGSTRSDNGRRCRDTFLSLKTTCRKLGVSFWQYLRDRIERLGSILPLPEIMRLSAAQAAATK
jgi:hypothetical protein